MKIGKNKSKEKDFENGELILLFLCPTRINPCS